MNSKPLLEITKMKIVVFALVSSIVATSDAIGKFKKI